MATEKEKEDTLELFRKYILSDLTEDLKIEFEELKIEKPIEYCYLVFPVHTNSKDEIDYWRVSPDAALSQRLKDYISICFEKAKHNKLPPVV